MHPKSFVPIALLIVSALAGCVADNDAAAVPIVTASAPAAHANLMMKDSASPPEQKQPSGKPEVRAVPIKALYDDGGGGPSAGAYEIGMVNFTGDMRGHAPFQARVFPPTGDHVLDFEKNPLDFTGSIEGCGSGSITFYGRGYFQVDPNGLRTVMSITMMPGTTTTGLAGVVAVDLKMDSYVWPDKTPIEGTIWCK